MGIQGPLIDRGFGSRVCIEGKLNSLTGTFVGVLVLVCQALQEQSHLDIFNLSKKLNLKILQLLSHWRQNMES